ncbi:MULTISPECIES: hypothetical protein [unclassified Leucobacter]|uniref:hypothetical protein n=1 Tax=unclassified Leucobacter TaxID=2621730 RepID=UPI00165EACC4|nr:MULTISPECIES: hypothetical protein [unclassified Leucobacter]MBC9937072.1 hypothetical protein [Leucobacter sp. cx-87]
MSLTTRTPRSRERTHALAGRGPIVDRARQALRHVATQFGEIVECDDTTVRARSADGIEVVLSYAPGNYVFSRVYNLTIEAELPSAGYPAGVTITHKHRSGPRFTQGKDFRSGQLSLAQLNAACAAQLDAIDVLQAGITGAGTTRTLRITPMGGSYVWVLIPPVFKATSFPPGEPDRILQLVRSVRGLAAATVSPTHTT